MASTIMLSRLQGIAQHAAWAREAAEKLHEMPSGSELREERRERLRRNYEWNMAELRKLTDGL